MWLREGWEAGRAGRACRRVGFASAAWILAVDGRWTLPRSKPRDAGSYLDNWKKAGEVLTSISEWGFHVPLGRETERELGDRLEQRPY